AVIPKTRFFIAKTPICRECPLSRCVPGENQVASFGLIVTGKACFHKRLVARLTVLEMSESPAACRGVLFRVLDHKLNIRGGAGYKGLRSAKHLVVLLRRSVTVVQSRDDCAVGEWQRTLAVGFDCCIVA